MPRKNGLGKKGLDLLIPNLSMDINSGKIAEEKESRQMNTEHVDADQVDAVKNDKNKNTASLPETKKTGRKAETEKKQETKTIVKTETVHAPLEVKLSQVEPNRDQPRSNFDEDSLEELAESIRTHGIIQPIVVVKKDKHYEIVSGERRWRAAKLAGLKTVPVLVKEFSDQDIMEISLIENIQREDLNPIEEAIAYQKLIKEFHLKQEDIAKRVGKARTAIANSVRLLKLDEAIQKMLIQGEISSGHAKVLLGLDNKDEQYDLASRIVEEGLSVRELEEIVRLMKEEAQKPEEEEEKQPQEDEQTKLYYQNYENLLRNLMGTKVNIKKKKNDRGKIEIEYYSMDELERLLAMLQNCES